MVGEVYLGGEKQFPNLFTFVLTLRILCQTVAGILKPTMRIMWQRAVVLKLMLSDESKLFPLGSFKIEKSSPETR